jgi:hypothetical protein
MTEPLSDAEWEELHGLRNKLGEDEVVALLIELSSEHGRIPTPADEGLSGWWAREIATSDEQMMRTRVGTGLWRRMLTKLRVRQTDPDEKGGA